MRLNKFIAHSGYSSRRKADELIFNGDVIVNGIAVREPGYEVDIENDYVKIGAKIIRLTPSNVYFMLNKPVGFLTSNSDSHNEFLARDIIPFKGHLYNIGRLDKDSEGLVIYTNDGELTQIMTHPKFEISKTYNVELDGVVDNNTIAEIEKGVLLSDGLTAPCTIKLKRRTQKNTRLSIIIREGKNREIRRMFEHFGFNVIRLKRIKHGSFVLDDLPTGKYREFNKQELELVKLIKSRKNRG